MNTTEIDKEGGAREGICPRCGIDVEWEFANQEQTLIEVRCPDCGRFEISKAEFDVAEDDIATQDDQ